MTTSNWFQILFAPLAGKHTMRRQQLDFEADKKELKDVKGKLEKEDHRSLRCLTERRAFLYPRAALTTENIVSLQCESVLLSYV